MGFTHITRIEVVLFTTEASCEVAERAANEANTTDAKLVTHEACQVQQALHCLPDVDPGWNIRGYQRCINSLDINSFIRNSL